MDLQEFARLLKDYSNEYRTAGGMRRMAKANAPKVYKEKLDEDMMLAENRIQNIFNMCSEAQKLMDTPDTVNAMGHLYFENDLLILEMKLKEKGFL